MLAHEQKAADIIKRASPLSADAENGSAKFAATKQKAQSPGLIQSDGEKL